MTPKRILMFHPTHKTAVNSIAELFPDTRFDLVRVPEMPVGHRESLCSDGKLYPFAHNARIVEKTYADVDENDYDLYISWPLMATVVRRAWKIPGVMMFLNAEDPFVPGFRWYVANTYSTMNALPPIPNRSHIFPTLGKTSVGHWIGYERKAYFLNDVSFVQRSMSLWNPGALNVLSTRVPFSRTPDLVPRSEYLNYRRRLRVYVEISHRKISCALLESMMMGQPVVAPDDNDWNVVIENGLSGLLYKSQDEMVGMIMSVINDDALARRLGAEGLKRAEEIAGDDVRRAAWTRVFNEVLP